MGAKRNEDERISRKISEGIPLGDRDYSLNSSERNVLLGEHNKNIKPRMG